MRDEIEETVEPLTARGASREEIGDALLGLDRKWTGKRSCRSEERQERTRMLGRLGQLLQYFIMATQAGTLLQLIKKAPISKPSVP